MNAKKVAKREMVRCEHCGDFVVRDGAWAGACDRCAAVGIESHARLIAAKPARGLDAHADWCLNPRGRGSRCQCSAVQS